MLYYTNNCVYFKISHIGIAPISPKWKSSILLNERMGGVKLKLVHNCLRYKRRVTGNRTPTYEFEAHYTTIILSLYLFLTTKKLNISKDITLTCTHRSRTDPLGLWAPYADWYTSVQLHIFLFLSIFYTSFSSTFSFPSSHKIHNFRTIYIYI